MKPVRTYPVLLVTSAWVFLGAGCTTIRRTAINQLGAALAAGGTAYASDNDPELIRAAAPFSLKLIESLHLVAFGTALLVVGSWQGFLDWRLWLFVAISVNANQVHKWSHRTRAENGPIISLLQDIRVLQTPRHHAKHHTDPKNTFYCPVTNLVNPLLERLKFWQRVEGLIARATGIRHRHDTSNRGQGPGPVWLSAYRPPGDRETIAHLIPPVRPPVKEDALAKPTCTRSCENCRIMATRYRHAGVHENPPVRHADRGPAMNNADGTGRLSSHITPNPLRLAFSCETDDAVRDAAIDLAPLANLPLRPTPVAVATTS